MQEIVDPPKGPKGAPFIDLDAHKAKSPELFEWMAKHQLELRKMADAKASEYGSLDLVLMGNILADLIPGLSQDGADRIQAAIAFYALGKLSRVFSALQEGKPAPTDSWLDLEVYALMAQRVMEIGDWP